MSRDSSHSRCDLPRLLTSSFQAAEDYAAEYQGDTNPKKMPNFSPYYPSSCHAPFSLPPTHLLASFTLTGQKGPEGKAGPNSLIHSHLSVQTAGDAPTFRDEGFLGRVHCGLGLAGTNQNPPHPPAEEHMSIRTAFGKGERRWKEM